ALEGELVTLGPLRALGDVVHSFRLIPQTVEVETDLAIRFVALDAHGGVHGILVNLEECTSRRAERVESTGLDERLDRALVRDRDRNLAKEVVERREPSLLLACPGDVLDHRCA